MDNDAGIILVRIETHSSIIYDKIFNFRYNIVFYILLVLYIHCILKSAFYFSHSEFSFLKYILHYVYLCRYLQILFMFF